MDLDRRPPDRPAPSGRTWRSCLVAVVAGGLVVTAVAVTRGHPGLPRTGGAVEVLLAAAQSAERLPDGPPGPRTAQVFTMRRFALAVTGSGGVRRDDQLIREWRPSDPAEAWVRRVRAARPGEHWSLDRAARVSGSGSVVGQWSGRCGDYFPRPGRDSCERPGGWADPSPAFLAGLPRDAEELAARLRADADSADGGHGRKDSEHRILRYAVSALERGIDGTARAGLYRAVATLPGMAVDRGPVEMVDGRTGRIVYLVAGGLRTDLAVDPATGAFLGWRRVLMTARDGLPSGTVAAMATVRVTTVETPL